MTHAYKITAMENWENGKDVRDLTGDNQIEFIKAADKLTQKGHCKSEEPVYHKTSGKLTGNSFDQNVTNDYNSVVFWYSKDCHTCTKFGPLYEKIAAQSLRESNKNRIFAQAKYYRINGHLNDLKSIKNYPWTPIFAVVRKGYADRPLVLRPQFLTPQGLIGFIESSLSYDIIDKDIEEKLFDKKVVDLRGKRLTNLS